MLAVFEDLDGFSAPIPALVVDRQGLEVRRNIVQEPDDLDVDYRRRKLRLYKLLHDESAIKLQAERFRILMGIQDDAFRWPGVVPLLLVKRALERNNSLLDRFPSPALAFRQAPGSTYNSSKFGFAVETSLKMDRNAHC